MIVERDVGIAAELDAGVASVAGFAAVIRDPSLGPRDGLDIAAKQD